MSDLSVEIGKRIRNYRIGQKMSQEELAEKCGLHPTYIGQLERGEKNATLESIEKVSLALNISLSKLFENLGGTIDSNGIPSKCYEFISSKEQNEQEKLYKILLEIDRYKNN